MFRRRSGWMKIPLLGQKPMAIFKRLRRSVLMRLLMVNSMRAPIIVNSAAM